MTKKKKIEVKTVEDIKKLEKEEQAKWENLGIAKAI